MNGIKQIHYKIKEKLSKKFTSNNSALITRERHRVKLNECLKEIDHFLKKDQNKVGRKKNESKANITTHTSLTDFDNDSESEGDVPEQDEGYKQEGGVYN